MKLFPLEDGAPAQKENINVEVSAQPEPNPFYWYLKVFRQYADFKGRARRKEFWLFNLFNVLFALSSAILDTVFGDLFQEMTGAYLNELYILAVMLPSLAVTVRRLHDIGKSGWMIFILLIPYIGAVWLFVLLVTDSAKEANKWGANPKQN
ncbi:MAG: DUF805 domain-containing protein [Bacteroidota bacterium]|jgi:uncharacterized membrane protein YhaH (DUF805 family)